MTEVTKMVHQLRNALPVNKLDAAAAHYHWMHLGMAAVLATGVAQEGALRVRNPYNSVSNDD